MHDGEAMRASGTSRARARRNRSLSDGKLGALHTAVTMEREVSLPFAPPTPAPARRPIERAESSALRLEVASLLEQRSGDIAAHWWGDARAPLPDAAISTAGGASVLPNDTPPIHAPALVRALAAVLAAHADAGEEIIVQGYAVGTSAFTNGMALHSLLHAFDRLVAICVGVVEEVVVGDDARVEPLDAIHVCRGLQEVAETATLAAARGFAEAADHALQERFRRLRHDLRNPIGTIQSALSLMADESVPEEARRSPRFRTMIERNTVSLDQMIVARLSDAEARLLLPEEPRTEGVSASLGLGEARDDLARAGERDDRQAGSF